MARAVNVRSPEEGLVCVFRKTCEAGEELFQVVFCPQCKSILAFGADFSESTPSPGVCLCQGMRRCDPHMQNPPPAPTVRLLSSFSAWNETLG